ncbi:hypothetical protein IVB14_06225 [Bradyrhizobium sp. 180]|nr:hypothetical protein [Bradyrhizobium sp. 180]
MVVLIFPVDSEPSQSAFVSRNPLAFYGFRMTVIAAGLTAFYSWRLVLKTLVGGSHDRVHYEAAHESPIWMLIPIGVLAAGSIFAGFPFKEVFAGSSVDELFRESLKMHPHTIEDMVTIPEWIIVLPTVLMAIGVYISYAYEFLLKKRYFDELHELIFVRLTKCVGRFPWKFGEGYVVGGFGPDGVSARVLDVTRNVVKLQTGYIYHHAFAMLIGVAGLITWFMFGVGGR